MVRDVNVGDVSGCLEIIGDYSEAEYEVRKIVTTWAKSEWEQFDKWKTCFGDGAFKRYYELNKIESDLYDLKKTMPESFVDKYRNKSGDQLFYDKRFLCHKKKPNTNADLKKGYMDGQLFKVKCNICNRFFYMDSESFQCVKWRSCMGAECLVNTVNEQAIDYSHSLYEWKSDAKEIQVLDYQISKVEELSKPLTYYGLDESLSMAYISDIHMLHHRRYYNNSAKKMIRNIVDKLYGSIELCLPKLIIFGGDISSDKDMTMEFYAHFMRKYDFRYFEEFKSRLEKAQKAKKIIEHESESKYVKRRKNIGRYIDRIKNYLMEQFDFFIFETYKKTYRSNDSYETAFDYYKMVKSYKKHEITDNVEKQILEVAKLMDIRDKYDDMIEQYEREKFSEQQKIEQLEKKYLKTVDEMNLSDYEHVVRENVFVVLGNHEYIDFPNVKTAVSYYEKALSRLGITLLHNNYQLNDRYLIFGGTGFAKYDLKWNADRIICCSDFSREDEIKETTIFEENYKKAFEYAKRKGLCFICVSHYPISACLNNKFDKEAIYFTGHNHHNEFVKTVDKVLYADNQIGYKDNDISFKIATTGYELNPYHELSDGLYQTTIADYLQFYRYVGEDIGKGGILYQRCQDGKANLYVVKHKNYYGFFIVTLKGNSKGISIVNGGKTKKLTMSTDISWICENFDIVLSKYLQALLPLRNVQERLSKELKELGLSGKIHGCIVDINYYHHIMLNPVDGSVTFYFSSVFGMVKNLDSFDNVIKSLEIHKSVFDTYDCSKIQRLFDEKSKNGGYLLGRISKNNLLESQGNNTVNIVEQEEQIVSRRDGMYGVSRKVNPLQRLFSAHVLRDYDLRLTETKQESYRQYLYLGREFMYEGIEYRIVEDDGSEIITAEELQESSSSDNNELQLAGERRKFAISALKSKFANINEFDSYWKKD